MKKNISKKQGRQLGRSLTVGKYAHSLPDVQLIGGWGMMSGGMPMGSQSKGSDPNPLPIVEPTKPKKDSLSRMMLDRYSGKAIAILCNRYWYRGILAHACDEYITLSKPFTVEVTGEMEGEQAIQEMSIPSDVHISPGAIELVCVPKWASYGYKEESDKPQENAGSAD